MALNRVVIEGNLTWDSKLTEREDKHILNFRMAVNEKRPDGNGNWVDAPVFIDCVVFGLRAEKLAPFLTKGTKVTVDGKLRYSEYMKDDEKRSKLSVVVDHLEFSGSRRDGANGTGGAPTAESPAEDTFDEDIPF